MKNVRPSSSVTQNRRKRYILPNKRYILPNSGRHKVVITPLTKAIIISSERESDSYLFTGSRIEHILKRMPKEGVGRSSDKEPSHPNIKGRSEMRKSTSVSNRKPREFTAEEIAIAVSRLNTSDDIKEFARRAREDFDKNWGCDPNAEIEYGPGRH